MAITPTSATTNFFPNSNTPSIAVPSDAVTGDRLYAVLTYFGLATPTAPSGWTEIVSSAMDQTGASSDQPGWLSVVYRPMAAGVTSAQWTIPTVDPATGVYAKSTVAMIGVRGGAGHTIGAVAVRSGSDTNTVIPGVTVAAGGYLLAIAGDRVSSQTTATVPTGMTELAKYIYSGGGGGSLMIAGQSGVSGASGTRTATYGLASVTAAGVLLAITSATGNPPTGVSAGANTTITLGATQTLAGTATGATSYAWSAVSYPGTTAPTISSPTSLTAASVTPAAAGTYVFRLTATNADGSTTADTTVTVNSATARPIGTLTNTAGFNPVGGAASLEASLADSSDATYGEATPAAGQGMAVQLAPLKSGAAPTFYFRARSSVAPVHTVTVRLLQGATVIATRTQPLTTNAATYPFALTTSEASAITNWNDLRIDWTV